MATLSTVNLTKHQKLVWNVVWITNKINNSWEQRNTKDKNNNYNKFAFISTALFTTLNLYTN